MEYRIEHDTMGEVRVPADHFWGAQTQRSLENFAIGTETIPAEVIRAFAVLKSACAASNMELGRLDRETGQAITQACAGILEGRYPHEFPLKVWQTGSGTQSNMNVNEVIAHIAAQDHPGLKIHPNDHVNMSQSSNDVIKIGRTHLQDAVPLRFSQEISGWRAMLEENRRMLDQAADHLRDLAIGGTAVGTGLNCPAGFDRLCAEKISALTGDRFRASSNKFHALTSKDAYVFTSGALKALAANLMKIANDVRWLASGPRCGIGEISIPENEPGSSIMPGKVNPTQCEAITMIAVQVMGNDTAIGFGASQGNFQLNVFMPVLAYNMIQSVRLLGDGMASFEKNCIRGLKANPDRMAENLGRSLMLVTCLSPEIGYENAAAAAHKAFAENTTLKEAVLAMGFMTAEEYDAKVKPEYMV